MVDKSIVHGNDLLMLLLLLLLYSTDYKIFIIHTPLLRIFVKLCEWSHCKKKFNIILLLLWLLSA